MDDLARLAHDLTAAGAAPDDVARELVSRTTFPIAAIKALREGAGLSLSDAKDTIHRNLDEPSRAAAEQTWSQLRSAARSTNPT
jgi:ribosomal protein L7/L12